MVGLLGPYLELSSERHFACEISTKIAKESASYWVTLKNPKLAAYFTKIQKEKQFNIHKIIKDVKIWWPSAYAMLQCFLDQRIAVALVNVELQWSLDLLTVNEENEFQIKNLLRPFF